MDTVLTDDEIQSLWNYVDLPWEEVDPLRYARAIEAAVLAKLREQEPPGLRQLLKEVVCLTYRPDLQVQASELLAAPLPAVVQVPPLMSCRCFDDVSRRFCKDKNRCSRVEAQAAPEAPAQAIPAPWREAVKVAREFIAVWIDRNGTDQNWMSTFARHALAQLDSLEGGE